MSPEEQAQWSAPAESDWVAKPAKPRLDIRRLLFAGLVVFLCFWASGFGADTHSETLILVGLCILLVLIAYIAVAKVGEFLGHWKEPIRQPVVDAAFDEQFSVEVRTFVKGACIGSDCGVVWFGDGLMGFSGNAMSFVLSAQDVAPRLEAIRSRYPAGAIVLVGAPKDAYLFFTPRASQTRAFRQRLDEFKKENAPPGAERHWPPLHRYGE